MLTILVISIDRFLAIRYPFRDLKYTKIAFSICALIWVIGVGVSSVEIPQMVFQSIEFKDITFDLCLSKFYYQLDDETSHVFLHQQIYMFTLISIVFFLPLTGALLFYSCLLFNVKRFYRILGIQDSHHKSNIRNIAKMVILVLVTTVVCWLPLTIFWIQKYSKPTSYSEGTNSQFARLEELSTFHFVAESLVFLYSAIQPVIYFSTGTKLRLELQKLLRIKSSPPRAPLPTIAVVSDDEGFSSGSGSMKGDDEIDNHNNDDDDHNDRARKVSRQQVSRRKMSFFVDIDPTRTPPPTPKISQRSNEEIIINYSNEEITN